MMTKNEAMTKLKGVQREFIGLLGTGASTANPGHKLARNINTCDSGIRELTNKLRIKGFPICTNRHGVFWPANETEIKKCGRQLRSRIAKQTAAARVFDQYEIKETTGQGQSQI